MEILFGDSSCQVCRYVCGSFKWMRPRNTPEPHLCVAPFDPGATGDVIPSQWLSRSRPGSWFWVPAGNPPLWPAFRLQNLLRRGALDSKAVRSCLFVFRGSSCSLCAAFLLIAAGAGWGEIKTEPKACPGPVSKLALSLQERCFRVLLDRGFRVEQLISISPTWKPLLRVSGKILNCH